MKIVKVRTVKTPTRGTTKSAGLDFYVPEGLFDEVSLPPGGFAKIPSGIKAKIPNGYALIAFNKSGVAVKKGLQVGACVIDEDYQGEIHLHVINISRETTYIQPGDKLVQFILIPVLYDNIDVVSTEEELFGNDTTDRGEGGFGSTGK